MLLAFGYGEKIATSPAGCRGFVALLILPACYILSIFFGSAALAAPGRIPLVVVDTAEKSAVIKQVPLTGTVTSLTVAHLSSEVSGQVESVNVEVGDHVIKGDVLLQLDREIEELTLQAARAATEEARAQLADAKRRYQSAKRLRKQNNISVDELENRKAQVNIAQAALQRQLAEQQRQQALVKRYTVRAPFPGVISERKAEVGEWIDPGTPILTLIAIDNLRIDFQVPQEFYPHIDDDSDVTVTLDAIPGRKFAAHIDAVVPVSDPSARTFLMRVLINKKDVSMMPGMSAHGMLRLNTGRRGVVVSRDAILHYPDGRVTVWVVNQGTETTTVSEQPVKVGHSFDGKVAITEGLKSGTVVVVQGNESLQEGQTVLVQDNR
ncbi:MAG: efflux RND transporter periplasmic adaptor subunit [Gammaproteobacteria bacterium]|jgi:RND family efflux transporter MFP subunit